MIARMNAIGPVSYLFVGAVSAIVGLLPWLVTGMRLPVQNLWAVDVSAAEMPLTLLPFSQYTITLLVAVMVTGSAIAGGVARATRSRQHRFELVALVVGVQIVQVGATVQTAVTVATGLVDNTAANVYLYGLTAGTIAANLVGLLVLLLVARAPAPGAVIAVSLAAVAMGPWLAGLIARPFTFTATETAMALLSAARWVPAVIVGLAVARCGLTTIGRVAAAVVGFLALWIGPAVFTAVSAAAGSRVLAARPAEMVDYGAQVFVNALGVQGGSASLLIPAVGVMVLGLIVGRGVRRRRLEQVSAA